MQRPNPVAVEAKVTHDKTRPALPLPSVHMASAVIVPSMKQTSALRNQFF